jgi:hypothetical protein
MIRCRRSIALLWFAAPLCGQTVEPVPGFIQDAAGQFPLPAKFSFEEQIQIGSQGSDTTANPFAYGHAVQIRPRIHYDGIPNTTFTGSATYIIYFTVPGTSYYRHPEWRYVLMGTRKQPLHGASLYEQIRGEWLNFRDSSGAVQHFPRIRFRFGQNIYIGEGGSRVGKLYVGLYQEAIVQFPSPSYSRVRFAGARFFAGAGFDLGTQTQVLLGFKAEGEVSSSGSSVTLFYGPAFSIEYNFRRRHPLNENHRRTTAFHDF